MASFLDTLFGGGAEAEAADKDRAALAQYQGQALPALSSAYSTGTDALNKGVGAWSPLANLGQVYSGGAPTYMAALGIGSPDQVAQAQQTFQNMPGFAAMKSAAADAVARQRAVGGMGASGNADIDAMMAAAGITSQQYQNWVNNLQTAGGMGLNATGTAAGGQASGYGALANLAQNYGQSQANVYGNVASGDVAANNLQAAGEAAGAKNLFGAGMSIAGAALGMPSLGGMGGGGGGGGGSGGSSAPWQFTNTPLGSLFR